MSGDIGIGKLITTEEYRDAIHVAVAPAKAGEMLKPGDHVTYHSNGICNKAAHGGGCGIVDPFLSDTVYSGDRFWLFLYPGSITSLRHDWTHPKFQSVVSDESPFTANDPDGNHRRAIERYADQAGLDFADMMQAADDYVESGEYLCEGSRWYGFRFDAEDFWNHYTAMTGRVPKYRESFFSCSC